MCIYIYVCRVLYIILSCLLFSRKKMCILGTLSYYPLSSCNEEKGIDNLVTGNTLAHVSIASVLNIS